MIHAHVSPNRGDTIVLPDQRTSWGEIHEGSIWCWSHSTWEPIPDEWRRTEAHLKRQILAEWAALRRVPGQIVTPSDAMEELMTRYCQHAQYQRPDSGDLYQLFRLIDFLRARDRGFLVKVDVPRETSPERTP